MNSEMQPKQRHWRFSKVFWITTVVLVLVLVGFRIALPHIVLRYANQKLDQLPEYDGHIGDVDIHLIRGAYSIKSVEIVKTDGDVPVPFFAARTVDFSVEWRELFHGSIVGEVYVDKGALNFVKGPTQEQSQTSIDSVWVDVLEDLSPFQINRFEMRDSAVWFRDDERTPKVDIYVTNLVATATNLSNSRAIKSDLPAAFWLSGKSLGNGDLRLQMRLNPMAAQPTFDLNATLEQADLVAFNDFLEAYAKLDVKSGTIGVYVEMAAADGRFEGYVKPLLEDLDIVDLRQDKNPLEVAWEALASGLINLFKNHPRDRFATRVPFSGSFENPDVGVWAAVVSTLRNAFVKALPARLEESISPRTVKKERE